MRTEHEMEMIRHQAPRQDVKRRALRGHIHQVEKFPAIGRICKHLQLAAGAIGNVMTRSCSNDSSSPRHTLSSSHCRFLEQLYSYIEAGPGGKRQNATIY